MLWGVRFWAWGLFAVSLALWLTVNFNWIISEADHHEGLAAWVQSFGAIGGIAVAVFLARMDRRDRKRSDVRKAYALIQSLTGSIFLIDIDLNRVQQVIDQGRDAAPDNANWDRWFQSGRVDVPKPLREAMPMMQASEDEMVGRFRTVAMLAETFNDYMVKFQSLDRAQVSQNWRGLYTQISGQFALLRETVRTITGTAPGTKSTVKSGG